MESDVRRDEQKVYKLSSQEREPLDKLSFRIILTENCNLQCLHCFNSSERKNKTMDLKKLIEFLSLNKNYFLENDIKLMGGEPTIHPDFLEYFPKLIQYGSQVQLFTNGTQLKKCIDSSLSFKESLFSGRLGITINGFTLNKEIHKNIIDAPNINFHFVIPYTGFEKTIEKILEYARISPNTYFMISPDTQIPIITNEEKKKTYQKIWLTTVEKLHLEFIDMNKPFGFDHLFPYCFMSNEILASYRKYKLFRTRDILSGCCGNGYGLGLVKPNFDINYCNQTSFKIGTAIKKDGSLKTIRELQPDFRKAQELKKQKIIEQNNKCKNCEAIDICLQGCYFNATMRDT